ncbi:hypothetical protein BH11PSE8_BH11PSE8_21890 [soil metagenome]
MRTTHRFRRVANAESTGLGRPLKTALPMVPRVVGFYLFREHWNHLAGNWVYLLLLACPATHMFHGHGGHHDAGGGQGAAITMRKE